MSVPFNINLIEKATVIQFTTGSLMDPIELEATGDALYKLVDEQDKRILILDFERVQFISSQAIGILLTLNKKLSALKGSKFILCGVGPRLQDLLRITRLDRILSVKPTQKEAVNSVK